MLGLQNAKRVGELCQRIISKFLHLRIKTNKKRAKVGMPPDEPEIFMEAEIEYNQKGNYYLIKYQRGTIRAWGVFKG